MGKIIRKSWPRIRIVTIAGSKFYRVDARRRGTGGKQETFKSQNDALKRAGEIESDFGALGAEGLAMSTDLRSDAVKANDLLKPYGRSVLEAAHFYKAHLDLELKRQESALVTVVATAWHEEKKSGKTKKLRDDTLRGILDARDILTEQFGSKRILAITTADIRKYLDSLSVGLRRKFNLLSLISQFFNWAIAQGYTHENPAKLIKIEVEESDVHILTAAAALVLMKKCEESFKDLLVYHAICLFAGLRPTECQLLKWENVHLEEKTITVLRETSKTKETRNVPIEETLMKWLQEHKPDKLNGPVVPHRNFVKRSQALHVALGYRAMGENPEGIEWPQDVLRHSYGSYWLAKYRNRAQLAENMGNSVQIIKKHYKRVVSKSAWQEYWRIVPGYDGNGLTKEMPTDAEIKKSRMKRVVDALDVGSKTEKPENSE